MRWWGAFRTWHRQVVKSRIHKHHISIANSNLQLKNTFAADAFVKLMMLWIAIHWYSSVIGELFQISAVEVMVFAPTKYHETEPTWKNDLFQYTVSDKTNFIAVWQYICWYVIKYIIVDYVWSYLYVDTSQRGQPSESQHHSVSPSPGIHQTGSNDQIHRNIQEQIGPQRSLFLFFSCDVLKHLWCNAWKISWMNFDASKVYLTPFFGVTSVWRHACLKTRTHQNIQNDVLILSCLIKVWVHYLNPLTTRVKSGGIYNRLWAGGLT